MLAEIAEGEKQSHWMWFIFPQLRGLGSSATSQRFALDSLEEARRYLAHPTLGARLRECTALMLAVPGRGIESILGYPDDLKFRSSMTLFKLAGPEEPLFREALERYFGGELDAPTLALLGRKK